MDRFCFKTNNFISAFDIECIRRAVKNIKKEHNCLDSFTIYSDGDDMTIGYVVEGHERFYLIGLEDSPVQDIYKKYSEL